ncbi:MAG: anhydro-N-acetylmuramic acid kinase AnmK [Ruminiclostridium sp.]
MAIGLMSGTSADGIDAALVRIKGSGTSTRVELVAYNEYPYGEEAREAIFKLFNKKTCSVDYLCHMNFILGEMFAAAVLELIENVGLKSEDIDFIGSHGQTVYHIPKKLKSFGFETGSTLQIGEPAVIAERTGIVTIADFRVRDMAAGGQGAPLVPYTEYILYRDKIKTVGLQNIGGIANVTVLPSGCTENEVLAFDNGPGNMVIDEIVKRITKEKMTYDRGGMLAAAGCVNDELLEFLVEDEYFSQKPPKTTGREYFGSQYSDRVMERAALMKIPEADLLATVTALTARAITDSCKNFIIPEYGLDRLIIGGGGSYNLTLLKMLKEYMPDVEILTQEDIGLNSGAKEAVAFAILANETVNGQCNNLPRATGARNSVVMGKINI